MEALEAVIDEVALEGLDGITVPALWLRLETRVPPFPLNLDGATKQLVWQSLVAHHGLDFYLLPKERRPLVISNRYEGQGDNSGAIKARGSSFEDIYPFYIITDKKNGNQGSCQYFEERVLVTELISTESITCEEAVARWGEKLVIVANQTLRFRALIGWEGDPSLEIPDYSYCILEKIGRSRWQGEIQKDLQGIFKVDAGKTHYLRRVLDRNGLITMQTHVIKLPNGNQQHSLLLLLKRFHVDRRNKYDLLTEKACSMLSESENQMETLVNFREELCLPEGLFKRLYHYMASAGFVKIISLPLHSIQPLAENCKTKKGTDIMVKCMQLIKEYKRKDEEEEDDEDDEDIKVPTLPVDVIYEKDMLTQTYELIENRGTKGISQREIRIAMNVGNLEARMLCRLLERYMLIKGFMEDEGRQRTTKFISHVFVEESDLRKQFLEEKAKSEKLSMCNTSPADTMAEDKALPPESNAEKEDLISESNREELQSNSNYEVTETHSFLSSQEIKTSTPMSTVKARSRFQKKRSLSVETDKISASENDCSMDSFNLDSNLYTLSGDEDDVSVIEEVLDKTSEAKKSKNSIKTKTLERSKETYRLLKRRNLIVETVTNLRLVESLFTLQKMIVDQEKQEGISTRCCKKSILRIVQKLSQEGLVRLYRTVVVQDGISKKVEFIVHPSINPNDPLVKSAIEQIRFRISNSTAGNRTRSPQATTGKAETDEQNKEKQKHNKTTCNSDSPGHAPKKSDAINVTQLKNYHPVIVPGLGRSLGYLPKMPRLKITHIFLWHIVYGHPLHKAQHQQKMLANHSQSDNTAEKEHENDVSPVYHSTAGITNTEDDNSKTSPRSKNGNMEEFLADNGTEQNTCTVYADEASWFRFVPPATVHSDYGPGWVLVSDILLCLPLSIFIQIVQVSYKVDNLNDYLNDPIKKHTLIRYLPRPMRQQLLYKRRYIFSVYQRLQKLSCMGLLQFGPTEKFQDKDQIFVYIKKKATIVDTTVCEPHYNIAKGSHPFEKRSYTLETFQDVENFWFDLQFVCLNTPLGIVRCSRSRKTNSQDDGLLAQDVEQQMERKCNILESVPGSREVVDDGSVPGDGLGAGGLDSSLYSHLKRNWIWISYIINNANRTNSAQDGLTLRLQTFLTKHSLPLGSRGSQKNVFGEVPENGEIVQMVKESTENRNKRVCGGKNQKRKRLKRVSEKKPKAKKKKMETKEEINRRIRYHDEADQNALQRMTRLRVAWSAQEDGLLMLCRIASNILNTKVKRPFVPWQVVRDIMHSSLDESLDKTSHSIGRRARYIMKNPQTYLNYKVCLAEVYQDKGLVEDFMNRKACYVDPKVCAAEFTEFVGCLKQKFSSALGDPAYEIPNNITELFNRFRVLAVGDESNKERESEVINSIDEIQILVLQNLILSTLALSDMQMKTCRSLQTFRMYGQFRDDILVKAFVNYQKKRLVNRRRVNHTLGPKKNRALPFVPMSFQLSQTYYRFFTWRFPSTICTESFCFLETLKTYGNADQSDVFIFGDKSCEDSEATAATDMMIFPLNGPGGQCATILSLMLLGFISVRVKIPDQIVVVDSTLVDNEVMKSLGKDGLDDEDFDDDELDDTLSHKRKIEVKSRQASHTNYLLMRGCCAPGIVSTRNLNPNDSVVVNACQVRVKLRNTPLSGRLQDSGSFSDFITRMPSLPPHFTDLLNIQDKSIDTFIQDCIRHHGYSEDDVSCILDIHSAVKSFSYFGMKMSDVGETFQKYENIQGGRTRSLQQYIQDLLSDRQVLQVGGASVRLVTTQHADPWLLRCSCLRKQDKPLFIKENDCSESAPSAIEDQGETDISIYEPPRKKAHLELSHGESLDSMEKTTVDLVGPVLTETDPISQKMDLGESGGNLLDEVSDCCFLGRPWRIVDGSLNKPVCKGMLEAVLYQIMTKPGITENSLINHYKDVLQPVIVLELLQVLEQIGCIKKQHIERQTKASLFSKPSIPQLFKTNRLSDGLTAFYEPAIDCTMRLGGIFPSEVNWNKWVL